MIAATVLATALVLAVLGAEARRLPTQNLVALAVVSLASAVVIEGCVAAVSPPDLPSSIRATALTMANFIASRAFARLPGPGPGHLFVRTLLAAVVPAILVQGPGGDGALLTASIRIAGTPLALLLLAPWWINKRLAPARTPEWAGFASPALLLGLAIIELRAGNQAQATFQALGGSIMASWAIRSQLHGTRSPSA